MFIVMMVYAGFFLFMPRLSQQAMTGVYFVHALSWSLFHSFGLGLLLREQSRSKFLVRHFMKNYHYPSSVGRQGAVLEAFTNWKSIYNFSLCMTYRTCASTVHRLRRVKLNFGLAYAVSLVGFVWKVYSIPSNWTVGTELLRHTMGVVRSFRPSGP